MLFVSRVGGFTDIPWEAFNVAPGAAPSVPSFLICIFPTASFIRMLIPVCSHTVMSAHLQQARNCGVAWGGQCHPWETGCHPSATIENFLAIFYCCFIVVDEERSPKILVKINLRLCNKQENSIFPCTHFMHMIVITLSTK